MGRAIKGIDKSKRNPMHYAYRSGDQKIIAMLEKFGYSSKERRDVDGLLPYQSTHMANSAFRDEPDRWEGDGVHHDHEVPEELDDHEGLGEDAVIDLMLTNCDYAFVTSYENAGQLKD